MYYICINEGFSINKGDFYTLVCAFCFAGQIIAVDRVITNLDGVRLSLVQFITSTILNGILMFIFETPSLHNIILGLLPIAYAGIMSSGVAFTLQIVAQRDLDPTIASLAMCLESVFSALAGWLILGETLSATELCGCALMFGAIVASQLPEKKRA